jgi:chromosome segregation ATPase
MPDDDLNDPRLSKRSLRCVAHDLKAHCDHLEAEIARLTVALAEAQRERDEARDQYEDLATLLYGEAERDHEDVHRRLATILDEHQEAQAQVAQVARLGEALIAALSDEKCWRRLAKEVLYASQEGGRS